MEPFQSFRPQYTPEQEAEMSAALERRRAEWAAIAEANDAWKRPLLQAGPPLRDIEAAMACMDSCHPRVRMEQHEGGSTCHCQDTAEQKAARRVDARKALAELSTLMQPTPEELAEETWIREAFERTAAELEVDIKYWGGAVPFQIEGRQEGRTFYVRARHERFSIRVAPDTDPDMFYRDPQEWGDGDWMIDDGPDETLFGGAQHDAVYALKYTAGKIREFLHPPAPCPHILTNESGGIAFKFCPLCGYLLEHVTGVRQ